jgi:cell wall-associated NlpC family hydrolase
MGILKNKLLSSICYFALASSAALFSCGYSQAADLANTIDQNDNAHEESKIDVLQSTATELVVRAVSLLGIKYVFGGSFPETGLDCSGLVQYVYKAVIGTTLPRTSLALSHEGVKIIPKNLLPGDLVFYNTRNKGYSHVGIYIGENKFIHSPSTGGNVRVESMEQKYWRKRFNGGRRLLKEYPPEKRWVVQNQY